MSLALLFMLQGCGSETHEQTPSLATVTQTGSFIYRVESGDTSSEIAQKFGITKGQLKKANPKIQNINHVELDDILVIPFSVHRVREGENLTKIATHYGVGIAALMALNPESGDTINVDDAIRIPWQAKPQTSEVANAPAQNQPPEESGSTLANFIKILVSRTEGPSAPEENVSPFLSCSITNADYEIVLRIAKGEKIASKRIVDFSHQYILVVDPGHNAKKKNGLMDVGSVGHLDGKEYYEHVANGVIAEAVANDLESRNLCVVMTRRGNEVLDEDLDPLTGRVALANAWGEWLEAEPVYLGIHANHRPEEKEKGKDEKAKKDNTGQTKGPPQGMEILVQENNTDAEEFGKSVLTSVRAAYAQRPKLLQLYGVEFVDRGIKPRSSLAVLKAKGPVRRIIVEVFFMDNGPELEFAMDYPEIPASGIAQGVENYLSPFVISTLEHD